MGDTETFFPTGAGFQHFLNNLILSTNGTNLNNGKNE